MVICFIVLQIIFVIGIMKSFISNYWTPVKMAVKEEEFKNYGNVILVKEMHYTGTGWAQVGDENGFFSKKEVKDIQVLGNRPPLSERYQCVNVFLCEVEYEGKKENEALGERFDTYTIVEWYPVYPVVRETLLPGCLFPKKFMSKKDVIGY